MDRRRTVDEPRGIKQESRDPDRHRGESVRSTREERSILDRLGRSGTARSTDRGEISSRDRLDYERSRPDRRDQERSPMADRVGLKSPVWDRLEHERGSSGGDRRERDRRSGGEGLKDRGRPRYEDRVQSRGYDDHERQ